MTGITADSLADIGGKTALFPARVADDGPQIPYPAAGIQGVKISSIDFLNSFAMLKASGSDGS